MNPNTKTSEARILSDDNAISVTRTFTVDGITLNPTLWVKGVKSGKIEIGMPSSYVDDKPMGVSCYQRKDAERIVAALKNSPELSNIQIVKM